MNFILDHFIEFIIAYIIVSIGVRIWFAVSLSAAKRDIRKFDTLFDTVKSRISGLEDALKTIQKRIAALEEAGIISSEQAPAAAEDRQSHSYGQQETLWNSDLPYGKEDQESRPAAAETQKACDWEPPVLDRAAQSEKPETPAAPPLSAFSVWLKKQCSIESVISKLGILLLLIGIGSVFKLLHSRGLIGKEIILALGCGIGLALAGLGFTVRKKERFILSQVLFGGSIVTFYLTASAAYMRYNVLSDFSAFLFLAAITVFTYLLAAAVSSVSVSVIGLTGSVFIPFALGFSFFDLTAFGLYICAVSALATATYFFKRWRILQFSSSIAFLSILTWLLLRTKLTPYDAQLFLLLVMLLWAMHLVPDFYFHLSGREKAADAIASPVAALINYAFSLFFAFKLSAYRPLPQGSVYTVFIFFYSLFSYICLKKKKLKTLGYAYIALAILSVYVMLIDRLQFDFLPAAALGFAVFLSWLWKKEKDRYLHAATHIVSLIGYVLAFGAILNPASQHSALPFAVRSVIYAAPMVILVFMQKERNKRAAQTLVFQFYVPIMLFTLYDIITDEYGRSGLLGTIERADMQALIILVLWSLYSALHYRNTREPDKTPFYEPSLYAAPILISLLIAVRTFGSIRYVIYAVNLKHALPVLMTAGTEAICGVGLFALSLFKRKTERNRFVYRLSAYGIILKVLLIDVPRIAAVIYNSLYRNAAAVAAEYCFHWGILFAGIFVLIIDRYYRGSGQGTKSAKSIGKLIIGSAVVFCYLFIRLPEMREVSTVRLVPLIVDVCNALIFLKIMTAFVARRKLLFFTVTAVFIFFSFTDVYLATRNNGILTLLWGFYSIAAFIYFLRKGDRALVYASLGLIIAVSAKLVVIDMRTVGIVSKTVTSVTLGAALLIVSYAVQPMLKKFQENQRKPATER